MGLVKEKKANAFDTTAISKGCFIFVESLNGNEPRAGIVTRVSETEIEVLFLPKISNVTNRFVISVSDISQYRVRWSEDLEIIKNYP